MAWQNRIVGTGDEAPDQLVGNPRNFRIHSHLQEGTIKGVLSEVGWVDTITVNKRTGFVVDGHMRVLAAMDAGEATVPVTYVDLSDAEEALILATFDPISAMAGQDAVKLEELLDQAHSEDLYVRELLNSLEKDAEEALPDPDGSEKTDGPPEMALQPFEQYDYVVLLFRNSQDWDQACERLGLESVAFKFATTKSDKPRKKIGLGRVVDGAKALELLGAPAAQTAAPPAPEPPALPKVSRPTRPSPVRAGIDTPGSPSPKRRR